MRAQVVHDDADALGPRVLLVRQPPHLLCEVLLGVPLSHGYMSSTRTGLAEGEEVPDC